MSFFGKVRTFIQKLTPKRFINEKAKPIPPQINKNVKPSSDLTINKKGQYYKVFQVDAKNRSEYVYVAINTNRDILSKDEFEEIEDYISEMDDSEYGWLEEPSIKEVYSYDGTSGIKRQLRENGQWMTVDTTYAAKMEGRRYID
jgi:hypothetical protein